MLAGTCSDGTVRIWIQRLGAWNELTCLGGEGKESCGSWGDVAFAPRHLGLRLAAGGEDGVVRVYSAMSERNLRAWELREEFSLGVDSSVTALSWCPSQGDAPMMLVANQRSERGAGDIRRSPPRLTIWGLASAGVWTPMLEFLGANREASHGEIRSVAWAPSFGRSYHYIASAGTCGRLCLWKVTAMEEREIAAGMALAAKGESVAALGGDIKDSPAAQVITLKGATLKGSPFPPIDAAHDFDHINGNPYPIANLAWNAAGTSLISGARTSIRIWKQNLAGDWECVEEVERERKTM